MSSFPEPTKMHIGGDKLDEYIYNETVKPRLHPALIELIEGTCAKFGTKCIIYVYVHILNKICALFSNGK